MPFAALWLKNPRPLSSTCVVDVCSRRTHQGSVEAVGFCATHPWVATGGTDGALKVWDSVSGNCRHTCSHPAGVTRLEWHPAAPVRTLGCTGTAVRGLVPAGLQPSPPSLHSSLAFLSEVYTIRIGAFQVHALVFSNIRDRFFLSGRGFILCVGG